MLSTICTLTPKRAICRARRMPVGKLKRLQRAVGRIYLLLTKEAAVAPSIDYLEDFRAARRLEKSIAPERAQALGKTAPA